ncbi:conserved hypothetical protein [Acinetobacter proteolyticus]|uniref:Uncharacterized protein n=1 Tax=Acinetobacter proteolyticus TaxID=1776741 RepID=A0A653K5S9_9GAMM|nr:conserved hypothetical protein [Acinetobacter proteolyticus]
MDKALKNKLNQFITHTGYYVNFRKVKKTDMNHEKNSVFLYY